MQLRLQLPFSGYKAASAGSVPLPGPLRFRSTLDRP